MSVMAKKRKKVKIISFIGWHNSGKTTLASAVVAELIKQGIRVGVVKSTKETELTFKKASKQNDTEIYSATGADVLLATPEEIILQKKVAKSTLYKIANHYFTDMDLVIGEGFKHEEGLLKIEVYNGDKKHCRNPLLAESVSGVVAVVMRKELLAAEQKKLTDKGIILFKISSAVNKKDKNSSRVMVTEITKYLTTHIL